MKSSYSFIAGMLVGIILFLAIIGAVGYWAVGIATPDFVDKNFNTDISKFLGDFSSLSILKMTQEIQKLYDEKNIYQPDADGKYYTIADFIRDYNIDVELSTGIPADSAMLELPLFTLFTDDGTTKFLDGITTNTTFAVVNLLTNNMFSDAVVAKVVAQASSLSDILNDPFNALAPVKLGEVIELDSSNPITAALAECSLKCVSDFMEGNFGEALGEGGSLEPLGQLQLDTLIEGDARKFLEGVTIADFMGEDGLSLDFMFEKQVGVLLGYTYSVTTHDSSDTLVYENGDIFVYQKADGQYIMSTDNEKTFYFAKNCTEEHTHNDDCFDFIWYDTNGIETTGINAMLAGYTISDLSEGNFDSLINDLTLRDALGDDKVQSGILASLADIKIGDMESEINDLLLGNLLEYSRNASTTITDGDDIQTVGETIYVNDNGTWYEATLNDGIVDATNPENYSFVWYKESNCVTAVTGIELALANNTITSIQDNGIADLAGDLTLGDALGEDTLTGVLASLADTKIDDLSTKIETLLLGEMLGYHKNENTTITDGDDIQTLGETIYVNDNGTWYEATLNDGIVDATNPENYSFVWYKESNCVTPVTGIELALANNTITSIKNDGIADLVGGLTLGDALGEDTLTGVLASLADTKIDDLSTKIETLLLGEMLGYHKNENTAITGGDDIQTIEGVTYVNDNGTWYEATLNDGAVDANDIDNYSLVWYKDEACTAPVAGIELALANNTITSIKNDGIADLVGDLTLGDALGEDATTGVLASLADTKIDDLNTKLETLLLGEMLGYEKNENTAITDGDDIQTIEGVTYVRNNGKWYEATLNDGEVATNPESYSFVWYEINEGVKTKAEPLQQKISNMTIETLQGGGMNAMVEGLTLGEALGDSIGTEGILFTLKDTKISEMDGAIEKLTIGEFLGEDAESSPILSSIKDCTLDEVGTAIDNTYLGTIQNNYRKEATDTTGYTAIAGIEGVMSNGTNYIVLDGENWYVATLKDDTVETDLENYSFVWFTDESCTARCNSFANKLGNLKISEMQGNALTDIVGDLTIAELTESGVLTLTADNETTLDSLFGDSSWKQLNIDTFISTMLGR